MASVSRGNLSSKQRLPRPMSTQGHGWIPGARHYPLVVSGSGHAVFPDGTQIKQRALLVEFNGDCTLKGVVYKFI